MSSSIRSGWLISANAIASAYCVRPVATAQVSCPVAWEEMEGLDPTRFTLQTVPERFAERGDLWGTMDSAPGVLDSLLELAFRDEREGLGDAPWPPNFPKAKGEPPRVQPSRRKAT